MAVTSVTEPVQSPQYSSSHQGDQLAIWYQDGSKWIYPILEKAASHTDRKQHIIRILYQSRREDTESMKRTGGSRKEHLENKKENLEM